MTPVGTDAVDYAWSHPSPQAIVAAGYQAVIRYLSLDPGKDLTASEDASLAAVGLGRRLVWETTADRATQGQAAGDTDARLAQAKSLALGINLPIWFACDEDVTWTAVREYYAGAVAAIGRSWVEPYGDDAIVDGFYLAFGPNPRAGDDEGWQTRAWSGGAISTHAAVLQQITPSHPPIAGAAGIYDEDTILRAIEWQGLAPPAPPPPPPPPIEIGDAMKAIPVNAHTDPNGEGWFPLPGIAWPVYNVVFNGQVPESAGYRRPGTWDGDNVGGSAQVNVYGFPPNATVLVYVMVPDTSTATGELADALAAGRPHEGPPAGTPDPRKVALGYT